MNGSKPIDELLVVMARLRDPENGCPWDVKQDFASIAPYTLEEAYEVLDAIEREDMDDLCDELGDLLLQVVFHAQMAKEKKLFNFDDVARAIVSKMVRRHPHVFGDKQYASQAEQAADWDAIKRQEKQSGKQVDKTESSGSVLEGVALSLPALVRAEKLGKRAARVGFDFPSSSAARVKLAEELEELDVELPIANNKQRIHEELGDVLFSVCNIARKNGIDAESSLRDANTRFEQRFAMVEQQAKDVDLATLSDELLEQRWQAAKRELARSK